MTIYVHIVHNILNINGYRKKALHLGRNKSFTWEMGGVELMRWNTGFILLYINCISKKTNKNKVTRDGRRYSVSRSGLCTWVSNAYTFIYVHITQTHTLNTIFKKKQLLHSFYLQPLAIFLKCDLLSL